MLPCLAARARGGTRRDAGVLFLAATMGSCSQDECDRGSPFFTATRSQRAKPLRREAGRPGCHVRPRRGRGGGGFLTRGSSAVLPEHTCFSGASDRRLGTLSRAMLLATAPLVFLALAAPVFPRRRGGTGPGFSDFIVWRPQGFAPGPKRRGRLNLVPVFLLGVLQGSRSSCRESAVVRRDSEAPYSCSGSRSSSFFSLSQSKLPPNLSRHHAAPFSRPGAPTGRLEAPGSSRPSGHGAGRPVLCVPELGRGPRARAVESSRVARGPVLASWAAVLFGAVHDSGPRRRRGMGRLLRAVASGGRDAAARFTRARAAAGSRARGGRIVAKRTT